MKSFLWGAISAGLFSFLSTVASAALIDNGDGLIYDDVLDITWAQPDVKRKWDDANAWAAGLTLGGVSGWRLPLISVAAGAGPFPFPPQSTATRQPNWTAEITSWGICSTTTSAAPVAVQS